MLRWQMCSEGGEFNLIGPSQNLFFRFPNFSNEQCKRFCICNHINYKCCSHETSVIHDDAFDTVVKLSFAQNMQLKFLGLHLACYCLSLPLITINTRQAAKWMQERKPARFRYYYSGPMLHYYNKERLASASSCLCQLNGEREKKEQFCAQSHLALSSSSVPLKKDAFSYTQQRSRLPMLSLALSEKRGLCSSTSMRL